MSASIDNNVHSQPPQSATHTLTGLVGFVAMIISMAAIAQAHTPIEHNVKAMMIVGFTALSMIVVDLIFFKVHRRDSTGLDWNEFNPSFTRIAIKIAGIGLTLAMAAGIYWLFPEYYRAFYKPAWNIIESFLPYLLIVMCGYFSIVDSVMKSPYDGYYHAGLLATGQWKKLDLEILKLHARTWGIKIFFIPLMLVFLSSNMGNLQSFFSRDWMENYMNFAMMLFWFMLTMDLVFTLSGYLFAFRMIDTHERSSEPTFVGWFVALICYPPFNQALTRGYSDFGSEEAWLPIMQPHSGMVVIWSIIILLLYVIYTWATMAFGARFSNLTHRGIITNGPYRFTKHPAYISKNISWWLMCMPFMAMGDLENNIRASLMLLLMNFIYFMRAWTEERHLSRDPIYREYQAWILKNGIFRWLPFKLCARSLS
jgi:protein-S-isoprenylcysteine O-methyltransferase Ste14